MSKWVLQKAAEFCASVRDGTHDSPKSVEGGGKPLVTSKVVKQGVVRVEDAYLISEKDYRKINERSKVDRWDILMTMIGTVGECAIVKDDPDYAIKNIALFKMAGDEEKSKWLYYYLTSPTGQGALRGNFRGSSQQYISLDQLRNLEVPVPEKDVRSRIVAILSDYDSAIDNARRQIALLEEAAMRLYREWFVVHADPNWEKKRLWDVCEYFRGVSYTSKEIEGKDGVPLITLKNIERFGGFREDRSKIFSGVCKDGSSAGPNDVLMAVTDMTKERRLVGHVAMVPDTYDKAQFSMDLIRLKGKLVSDSFLYAMLRYSTYADEFAVRASGANVLHLKPSSLDDCEVVVPRRELREKFDFAFVPMAQKKNALYRIILRLTEARDRLLPKLMSGEIEV